MHDVKFLDYLLKNENVLEQRHMAMAVKARAPGVIFKYLTRKGLKIDVPGEFYLATAARAAQVHVVVALVRLGANVNAKDENGRSALALCVLSVSQAKVLAVANFLLDNGADVNSVDNFGHTPLIECAKRRHCPGLDEVLKALFRRGADERAKDSNGLSIKRILLGRDCWGYSKETRIRDGIVVPNLGGRIYKQAAPILNRVHIWRDTQSFSQVCTTFYCCWDSKETSSSTPTGTSTENPRVIKKPRTSSNLSVLEAEVDILHIIFSFLRAD